MMSDDDTNEVQYALKIDISILTKPSKIPKELMTINLVGYKTRESRTL